MHVNTPRGWLVRSFGPAQPQHTVPAAAGPDYSGSSSAYQQRLRTVGQVPKSSASIMCAFNLLHDTGIVSHSDKDSVGIKMASEVTMHVEISSNAQNGRRFLSVWYF